MDGWMDEEKDIKEISFRFTTLIAHIIGIPVIISFALFFVFFSFFLISLYIYFIFNFSFTFL